MKVKPYYLDIDLKTPEGKAQKLTFAVEIDLGEHFGKINLSSNLHWLQQKIVEVFFKSCVEKDVFSEKSVDSYLPRIPRKKEVNQY